MSSSLIKGRNCLLAARCVTEFAHNVFAENDEQDNQGAKIQAKEATFQYDH